MNDYRKLANENYEEVTRVTSYDFLGRPVPRLMRKAKRIRNRAAKREEARRDIVEQCNPDSF